MSFWEGKRVLVTGGAGFLGRHVVEELQSRGATEIRVPRSAEVDLRDPSVTSGYLKQVRPDIIIHLAAVVGGIGANREHPGTFFRDNALMGIHLMEEARLVGVEKFVTIGTVCSYPKYTPLPFKESDLWSGYPEETNAPYGIAKKALLVQGQAYREEFGFNSIHLIPVNLYGPWDNFNPASSHVIPALIRKCVEARDAAADFIEAWGTGAASREFIFVRDAARGIVLGAEHYNGAEPVNLGVGQEITIRDLIELIAELTAFSGEIRWDASKPDGQPRRALDTSRARDLFGFEYATSFEDGLRETIAWWEAHKSVMA